MNRVDSVLELSSSFNCSEQYDYSSQQILPRYTPCHVLRVASNLGIPQFFDLSHNNTWLPIDDVRGSVKICLFYAGTSNPINQDVDIVALMAMRTR